MKKKGITLVYLIVLIAVMVVLTGAIVFTVIQNNPIKEANNLVMKSAMQKMIDDRNTRYKELLSENFGDESRINDDKFSNVISSEYTALQFYATKSGIIYRGEDEQTKVLAKEMGILVTDKSIMPGIKDIILSSTSCSINISLKLEDSNSPITQYRYMISSDATTWREVVSEETIHSFGSLTDKTPYYIKVTITDENDNQTTSEVRQISTKELMLGSISLKRGNKNGETYTPGNWSNEDIYLALNQSVTGATTYEITGAGRVEAGAQTDTTIMNEGVSQVVVTTTDGTNVRNSPEYVVMIDKTPPTFALEISNVTSNKIVVTAKNAADTLSGIQTYEYSLDGAKKAEIAETSYTFTKLSQNTSHVVKMIAKDKAGNQKVVEQNVLVAEVPNANSATTYTISPTAWTNTDVTLTVNFAKQGVDGLVGQISQDGTNYTDMTAPYRVAIPNNKRVSIRYRDSENQYGMPREIEVTNIDKEKPVAEISPNGGEYSLPTGATTATIKTFLRASDTGGSHIATTQYAWSKSNTVEPTTGWTNFTADGQEITKTDATRGTWYLWTKVLDTAGNRADTFKVSNGFGIGESKITLIASPTHWTSGNVTVSVAYGGALPNGRKAGIQGGSLVADATSVVVGTQGQTVYAEATDVAGNKVTATLKISNIDQVLPTTTISPNGGQYVLPTGGTEATLKARITAKDMESGLQTVQYAWSQSSAVEPTSGWTNYAAAGEDIIKENAVVGTWYLWTKVIDTVGNRAAVTKISNAFVVNPSGVLDENRIHITAVPTNWTRGDVAVTIAYGQNLPNSRKAGIGSASGAGTTNITVTEQGQTVYAEATDIAGNKVTATLKITNIDKVEPISKISPNGGQFVIPTGANAAMLKARIMATDSLSGLDIIQYAWSNSNTVEPTVWTNFTAEGQDVTKTGATEGNWYLWTKVVDIAGNRASSIKVSDAFTVNNNQTASNRIELVAVPISWTNTDVEVTVNYGANLVSNRKAGIGASLSSAVKKVVVTEQGQTVYAEAEDIAGNKVTASLQIKNIDKINPSADMVPNGGQYIIPTGATTSTLKTTLSASDAGDSKLKTVQYAWSQSNTVEPTAWTDFNAAGQEVTKTGATEGKWYVWTKVIDNAGNRAEVIKVSSAYIVNDPEAEASRIVLTPNITSWTNGEVRVTVTYGDNISQNRKAGIQGQTLIPNAVGVTVNTQHQIVYAEGTDVSGNKVTASLKIGNIDQIKPTTTISPSGGQYVLPTGSRFATIKTKLTATDLGGSNLKTVQYTWSNSPTEEPTSGWVPYAATGEDIVKTDAMEGNWYVWTKVMDTAANRADVVKVSAAFQVNNNMANAANKITLVPETTAWTTGNIKVSVVYGANLSKGRKAGLQGNALTNDAIEVVATSQGHVIYAEATDIAGNKVTATLKIANIDRVEPTTTIAPNGGEYVLPTGKTQATIQTRLTANDAESGLRTVQYAWSNSNTVEPTTWTNFTKEGQDIVKTDATKGTWYLWTNVIDMVGNRANNIKISKAFHVNDNSQMANKITLSALPTAWTNGNVVVTVQYGDNLPNGRKAGIGAVTGNNATSFTITTQDQTVYAEATDVAGNKVTASLKISNIDKIAPTTTMAPNGGEYIIPTGGTSATLKSKLTASDTGGSGLGTVQYAWSESNTVEPNLWANFTAAGQEVVKTGATEGTWYLWTKVIDVAGTRAEKIRISSAFTVNDPNAVANRITLSASPISWTNGNVVVNVSYGANVSQNRKAGIQGETLVANATNVAVTTQNKVVYAEGTDASGNKVTASLKITNIDKELPTVTMAPNGGQYVVPTGTTQATLRAYISASDTGGSQVATAQYAWSNSYTVEPTTDWINFNSNGQDIVKTDAVAGNWYLWTKVADKAGNRAQVGKLSNAFVVNSNASDTSKITLSASPTAWTSGQVVVSVTYGTNLSQNRKAGLGSASVPNATSVTVTEQNQIVYAEATDIAGNKVTASLQIKNIDKTAPTATISPNGGKYVLPTGKTEALIRTRLSASDVGGSGLNVIQYAWSQSDTVEPTTWTDFGSSGQDIANTKATKGNWYVWTKVTDKAGNRATTKVSAAFMVNDSAALENAVTLTTIPNPLNWTNQNVVVNIAYGSNLPNNRKAGIGSPTTVNATTITVTTQNQTVYAEAEDVAGNKVTATLQITKIDKVLPTVTMSPNGGQYIIPTGATTATLKSRLTANDVGGSGLGTVQYAWGQSSSVEPTTWSNYTAAGQEVVKTGATEGNWYLWTKVIDTAGNRATSVKTSEVFVVNDPNAVANRITLNASPTTWTNGNVTVSVTYGANISQNRKAGVQGGTLVDNAGTISVGTQNQIAYAEGTDPAGNKVITTLQIKNIDKVVPTVTMSQNGGQYVIPTGGTSAVIKTKLVAQDTGGSGLATVQYTWSNSNLEEPTSGWTNFIAAGQDLTKTDAMEGTWYLWTKVIDAAGNRATSVKVSGAFVVNNNQSSPANKITISANPTGWTTGNVVTTVSYGANLSQNRKAGISGNALVTNATTITADTQNQVVLAEATDIAGNKVTASLQVKNIDRVEPVATISPNGGKYVIPTGQTVAVLKTNIAANDKESGLQTSQYAWSQSNTVEPTTWSDFGASGTDIVKSDASKGNWYLWTKVMDKVGQRASVIKVSAPFEVFDGTDPANKITFSATPTAWTNGNVTVTVSYGANLPQNRKAGVDTANQVNGTTFSVGSQNQVVYAEATDIAGNKTTASLKIGNIDKIVPTTTMSPSGGQYLVPTGGTTATLKSKLTATDTGGSGLATVQYAWSNSNVVEPTTWTNFTAVGQEVVKTGATEGAWYLWTKVIDAAGSRAVNTKISGAFMVNDPDAVANRITLSATPTAWTNGNVAVTVSYGANVSQNRKAGIEGGTLSANATNIVVSVQNQVAYAEGTDLAGNKVTATLKISNIDKILPTTTISPNGGQYVIPTGASVATLKTRLTAADTGGSTLKTIQYAWSQSSTVEPKEAEWKTYNAAGQEVVKTDAAVGNWYVWTRVIDGAANRAVTVKTSSAFVVNNNGTTAANKISLSASPVDWTNGNVNVTVTYGTNLSQNRKAGVGSATTANATVVPVTAGGQVVYAEATDIAGNKVVVTLKITNIDKTPPTATISPNGGSYVLPTGSTVATLKARLSAADTGGSLLTTVQYAWSQSSTTEPTVWITYNAAGEDVIKVDATKGNWYLWTKVIDGADNRAENTKVSNLFEVNDSVLSENGITIITQPNPLVWTNRDVPVTVTYGKNLPNGRKAGIGSPTTANLTNVTITTQNQVVAAEAMDAAGNKVTATLQITKIDKIAPTTTISPNGGQYIIPTGGTTATLKSRLTAVDTGGSGLKTVQYAWNQSATVEPTTWTNYTAAGQEVIMTGATEGNWYLWTKVMDAADNRAISVKTSNVFVVNDPDAAANRITLSASPTAWTNGNVTVTVSYGANVSQNRKAGIEGGTLAANAASIAVTTQNQVAYAEGTDPSGNKVSARLPISNIDKVLPTVAMTQNGGQFVLPTGATKATLRTRISAADTGGSGLKTVQYAWSNSNTTEPGTSWVDFTASGTDLVKTDATEGNWYVWTKVVDTAGNRATTIKVSNAFTVNNNTGNNANKIVLSASPTGWTSGNVTVAVTYGANLSQNRKAGLQGQTLVANSTSVVASAQNQVIAAEATDIAGNKVTATLKVTNIDKVEPTVTISPNGGQYVLPTGGSVARIEAKLSATDNESGLKSLQYAWSTSNTVEPTAWLTFTNASTVTKEDAGKGIYYLWTRVLDNVDRRASVTKVSAAFTVNDTLANDNKITLITVPSPLDWTNTDVPVSVIYGKNLPNGRKAGLGSASGNGVTTVTVTSQNQVVYAEATDIAGNKVMTTLKIDKIDKVAPTATMSPNSGVYVIPTGKTVATIKTTVAATDTGGSGLDIVQYAWHNSNTVEPTTGWTSYTASGTAISKADATEGNWYLWTKVTDKAGTRATSGKVSGAYTVSDPDAAANRIAFSYTPTGWTNGTVSVSVAYGANVTQNRKAGIQGNALTAGATTVNVSVQNQVVYAEATDIAGNLVYATLQIKNIDKVPPTTTISPNGGQYVLPTGGTVATIKAALSASDVGGSGLRVVQYAWSTSPTTVPTDWKAFNGAGETVTKTDASKGNWYLWTNVIDVANNLVTTSRVSAAYTVNDGTAADNKITFSLNPSGWTKGNVIASVAYGKNLPGDRKAGIGTSLTPNAASVIATELNQIVNAEATDIAGNRTKASVKITNIDRTPPTCVISANKTSPTNASSITYTFTFSKNVVGFDATDVTVSTGTKGAFSGSGSVYTLVVTNAGSSVQSVSVPTAKCQDVAGNDNVASNMVTINIDRTPPTVSSINVTSPAAGTYKAGQLVKVQAIWSENITGTAPTLQLRFGSGAVRNATIVSISGNSMIYQYTIAAGDNGAISSYSYSGGAVTDAVGNVGTATNKTIGGNQVIADTTAPSCTITSNTANPTNASSITYTFTFSESVVGFAADDIVVNTGSILSINGSGSKYTAVINNPGSCTQTVYVPAGKCTDGVGNLNVQSSTISTVIDRTAPVLQSINVTSPGTGSYKAGQNVTLVANWDKQIKGGAPTLEIRFGSSPIRPITSGTVSGSTVTYSYTIQAGDNGVLVSNNYYGGSITDLLGNAGAASNKTLGGNSITADTISPTCSVSTGMKNPTNASSITYAFNFSENVAGFGADDIVLNTGTVASITGSGSSYTAVINNPGSGTQTVYVPAGKCTDSVGNGNTQSNTVSISIDRTAPTCTVTTATGSPSNASSITYTFSFSEAVTGFAADDITVGNGTITSFSGSGASYTAVISNAGSCTQTVSVAAEKCTDGVGNGNTQSNTVTRVIDRTTLTCTVATATGSPSNASSITYTFTFNKSVTGFVKEDITVGNGTITSFSGSGASYTAVISNPGSCTQTVYVAAGKSTDAVGNANAQSNTITRVIDRTVPTCIVATATGSPSNASSITYTFTFSESVTGFVKEDIAVGNGTITSFSGSGASYSAVISNPGTCTQTVYVAAGKCTDGVGNANAQSNTVTRVIDRTVPTCTVATATGSPSNASSITYTFTFSESVTGFVKEDIAVGSGTITSFSGSGASYSAVISNPGTCTQTVYVAAGKCTDGVGNANTQSNTVTRVIDRTAPTCKVTAGVGSPTNASSITYTIQFSENVLDFIYTDVTITNGYLSSFSGSGSTYTVVVSNGGSITQSVSVGANKCNDTVGNANSASNTATVVIDRTAPTCTIINNLGSPSNASSITYTISFSENVTGFDVGDIVVTNGTKELLRGSGSTYSLVVTNAGSCTQTISVPAGMCSDAGGNINLASNTVTTVIDRTAPTCTISANVGSPSNASSITYTFSFSESVVGFDVGDIAVTNGTKGAFAGSGSTYTLVVTNAGSCTQTVSIAAGVCSDAAGNANTAASKSIVIDRTVPTIAASPASDTSYQWFKEAEINASDTGGSGLNSNSIKYVWSSNATALPEASITQSIANGGLAGVYSGISSGKIYLHMLAKDNVGNTNIVVSGPYYYDNTAPTGTVAVTPGATSTELVVKANVTDAHSGISNYSYDIYDATGKTYIAGGQSTSNTFTITVGLNASTTYTINFAVMDKCLNKYRTTVKATTKAKSVTSDIVTSEAWGGTSKPAGTCQYYDTTITRAYNKTHQRRYDDSSIDSYVQTINVTGTKSSNYKNNSGSYVLSFNLAGGTAGEVTTTYYLPKYWNDNTYNKRLYNTNVLDNAKAFGRIASFQDVTPQKGLYSVIFRINNAAANATAKSYLVHVRKLWKINSGETGKVNTASDGWVQVQDFLALDTIGNKPVAPNPLK